MKKYVNFTGASLFALALIFSSCVSTPDYTPPDRDAELQQFLDAMDDAKLTSDLKVIDDSLQNKWHYNDVQIDPKGGVRYRVLSLGAGEKPVLTSNILFKYSVRLFAKGIDSKPEEENLSPNASTDYIPLWGLIAGWQTTLPLLPEGTVVQMFVPSGLGYGSEGRRAANGIDYAIPKDAILIFNITLVDVYTQAQ